jgi:hypothetical protein
LTHRNLQQIVRTNNKKRQASILMIHMPWKNSGKRMSSSN